MQTRSGSGDWCKKPTKLTGFGWVFVVVVVCLFVFVGFFCLFWELVCFVLGLLVFLCFFFFFFFWLALAVCFFFAETEGLSRWQLFFQCRPPFRRISWNRPLVFEESLKGCDGRGTGRVGGGGGGRGSLVAGGTAEGVEVAAGVRRDKVVEE